jgi:hypothetical protein
MSEALEGFCELKDSRKEEAGGMWWVRGIGEAVFIKGDRDYVQSHAVT